VSPQTLQFLGTRKTSTPATPIKFKLIHYLFGRGLALTRTSETSNVQTITRMRLRFEACRAGLLRLRLLMSHFRTCSECGLPLRGPQRGKQPQKAESINSVIIYLSLNKRTTPAQLLKESDGLSLKPP
jgi:hypothetical protein